VRLFVAVNLPAEERRAAYRATAPLRQGDLPVRWVQEASLHLTLKFLGEVAAERADPIATALDAAVAAARPFEVGLGGIGAFPSLARPRVVWLGVEAHPALELLANDVEVALATFGFEAELRPFQPHITLGRAKQGARPAAFGKLEKLAERVSYEAVVPVRSVDLMESELRPEGAVYHVRHAALLNGAG
jgi:RNA 2',3'-cyclic 3'-phosphodiesterase